MASTNKTYYIKLSQYIGTDVVNMETFNEDYLKIENAFTKSYKDLSISNNYLVTTKFNNQENRLKLFDLISDTDKGLTNYNEIKEKALDKIKTFGVGSVESIDFNIENENLATGIYSKEIDNELTMNINGSINDKKIVLTVYGQNTPKLKIKLKNEIWSNEIRVLTENDIPTLDEIWSGV